MTHIPHSNLNRRRRYLQIALNSTLEEAELIISKLPADPRILIEAGTPLIKRYGIGCISKLRMWWDGRLSRQFAPNGVGQRENLPNWLKKLFRPSIGGSSLGVSAAEDAPTSLPRPYIIADLKTMDRGFTEVDLAAEAGASAAVALGVSPLPTIEAFIRRCGERGIDPMIDMMNVPFPLEVLRKLSVLPPVVILHRGVDEEAARFPIPYHEIARIKGNFEMMIALAGGDTIKEVQSAIFNGANIVVVWKSFFAPEISTPTLAQEFLKEIT